MTQTGSIVETLLWFAIGDLVRALQAVHRGSLYMAYEYHREARGTAGRLVCAVEIAENAHLKARIADRPAPTSEGA